MWSGICNKKKRMVDRNRARDGKEKNQHNRTTGNRSGQNQNVEDTFPRSEELVARAKLSSSINEVLEEEITIINELKEMHDLGEKTGGIFKKVDFKRLNAAVWKVNNILRFLKHLILLKLKNLIAATCFQTIKPKKARSDDKTKSEPSWNCRIKEIEISIYWKDIKIIKWYQKGRLKNSMKNLESVKKVLRQY